MKLKQQVCKQTITKKIATKDTSINHLPKFNTDNSVSSSSTLMELIV